MTRHTMLRIGLAGAVLSAVLLTAAACARTVDGTGVALGLGPSSASRSAPSAQPTVPAPPPLGTGRDWPAAQLAGRLMPAPGGSTPWHGTWAATVSPTVTQFVNQLYPASSRAAEIAFLHGEGLTGIAHRTWFASDGNGVDIVLLAFTDDVGARSRYLVASHGKASRSDVTSFEVSGGAGYTEAALDPDGFIRSFVFGVVGNVVLEEFYFSPARPSTADAVAWTRTQLARLA